MNIMYGISSGAGVGMVGTGVGIVTLSGTTAAAQGVPAAATPAASAIPAAGPLFSSAPDQLANSGQSVLTLHGPGQSALAFTGIDVLPLLLLAAALIMIGLTIITFGHLRRRRELFAALTPAAMLPRTPLRK